MISITTQQKQFELRINFSFAGVEKVLLAIERLLSFSQVREVERQKRLMIEASGFNHWRI